MKTKQKETIGDQSKSVALKDRAPCIESGNKQSILFLQLMKYIIYYLSKVFAYAHMYIT